MELEAAAALQHIRASVVNHVGWVDYNRPPVNAFHHDMLAEVTIALDLFAKADDVRVVVLGTALPAYFSAGADLAQFVAIGREGMEAWVGMVHRVVQQIRGSEKPMIAAIAGVAVSGGLEMTLHCDVRFAAENARLGQPEVAINFIPPVGATQALARLMGRSKAIRFLYDGELVTAATAQQLGIVDELTDPSMLREVVQEYAESLCAKPPEALAAIRRTVTIGGGLDFDAGLVVERSAAVSLAETANFREGVAAFLEKRPPEWSWAPE